MTNKSLISIEVLCAAAETRGCEVRRLTNGAEIWFPENKGPRAVWHNGCYYGTADVVLSDNYRIGYGYNCLFHGVKHHGHEQSAGFAVKKLLSHPSFGDFTI
jgi:hypothetical protein